MKKLTAIFVFVMLAVPFIKTLPQESKSNSGALTQVYTELAQTYSVQGKEMSKEEEERLLKNLSPEMKAKLEEVKKLNKNKYYQLLRESSYLSNWGSYFGTGDTYTVGRALSVFEEASKERNEKIKKQIELEIDV
ncbi:MAG: hypothetical protein HY963_06725, partial [Ignavibacteriales bacterium]|nr:hypothetical protein [Ignavibacteriales bacterium]